MQQNMQRHTQNMQAICRFWWYCPILHAICKICKKYARYAKNANVIFNMQNMHCPLCWWLSPAFARIVRRCSSRSASWRYKGKCIQPAACKRRAINQIQSRNVPRGFTCTIRWSRADPGKRFSRFNKTVGSESIRWKRITHRGNRPSFHSFCTASTAWVP